MPKYSDISKQFEDHFRLRTKPLAIKMLASEAEVPAGAVRPLKDMGHHLSLCQAFSLARRQGQTTALFLEDNWCFEPVVGLGFKEPPEIFLDGHNRYPASASSVEAGSRWAHQLPKFEAEKYKGVVVAPLEKADFEPDIVVLYVDASALTHLLIAVNWIDGNDATCVLGGHSACVYAIVPTMLNNQFQVAVPCIGDRKRAVAQEDELIFSFPIDKAQSLIDGLKGTSPTQVGYPIKYDLLPEYQLAESYKIMGRELGIDIK
jgi:uncharacterized protein (DUF169 family)